MAEVKELKCYLYPTQISFSSQQPCREVRLMNPYKFDIQYVVKSTAPEYYSVAPPKGELHAEKSIDLVVTFVEQPHPPNAVDRFRVEIQNADGSLTGFGSFKTKHGAAILRTGSPAPSHIATPVTLPAPNLDLISLPLPPPPARAPPPPPPAPPRVLSPPPPPPRSPHTRLRWSAVGIVLLLWSIAHAYFQFPLLIRLVLSALIVVLITIIFRFALPSAPAPRTTSKSPGR